MTTKITAPDDRFSGSTYIGPTVLDFREGVASTDVKLPAGTLRYLEKRGYKVEAEGDAPAGDPSEGWSRKDLDAYAEANGVDVSGAKNKGDVLAAIEAAATGPDGEPSEGGTPDDQGGDDQ